MEKQINENLNKLIKESLGEMHFANLTLLAQLQAAQAELSKKEVKTNTEKKK